METIFHKLSKTLQTTILVSEYGWKCTVLHSKNFKIFSVRHAALTMRAAGTIFCTTHFLRESYAPGSVWACNSKTKRRRKKNNRKLSYRLENRASALCFRLVIMPLSGIWLFEFTYTSRVEFLVNLHGNGRSGVYKNGTHSSSTGFFSKSPRNYPHKI